MKRIEIDNYNTVVCIKEGRIENEATDIIVNWINPDMRSGPNSFYNIHKKAGPALYSYTMNFEEVAKETDAFSTSPAQLDCKLVVHAVMPVQVKNGYLKAFYNIAETVKKYKEQNLARTLSLYIPESANLHLAGIYQFLLDIGLQEVHLLYLTEKEFQIIDSFFTKHEKKHSLWSRMDKNVINWMVRLYSSLSTTFSRYRLTAAFQKRVSKLLTVSPKKSKSTSTTEDKADT